MSENLDNNIEDAHNIDSIIPQAKAAEAKVIEAYGLAEVSSKGRGVNRFPESDTKDVLYSPPDESPDGSHHSVKSGPHFISRGKDSQQSGGPSYYNVWDTVSPATDRPVEYHDTRHVNGRTVVDNGGDTTTEYRASFDKQTHAIQDPNRGLQSKTGTGTAAETTVIRKDRDGSELYKFTSGSPELARKVIFRAANRIIGDTLGAEGHITGAERTRNATEYFRDNLFAIYSELVDRNQNLVGYEKDGFRRGINSPLWHAPEWHQWGIVDHSRKFEEAIVNQVPDVLKEWGLDGIANEKLSEQIDGVSKSALLRLASILHDSGKIIAARVDAATQPGQKIPELTFKGHEEESGKIIRDGYTGRIVSFKDIGPILKKQGMTPDQVEYIARSAELHFDLGRLRKVARDSGSYDMAFVETQEFRDAAQEIIDKNPDFALEIGLLFLADCFSKSEVMATGTTDEEIEAERPRLEKELADRKLNPKLIRQALQAPVNKMVGVAYLTQWTETGQP